jgi:hypothetical protein
MFKHFDNNKSSGEGFMRVLVFAAALGLASLAQAYPAVGDQALFDGTINVQGKVQNAQIQFDLTAFDAAANQWTQTQTTTVGDQTQTETTQVSGADITTRETVLSALANCEAAGGKSGSITTPAGTFKSCAMTMTQGADGMTFYLADVPFAAAAFDISQNGVRIVMKLKSFVNGK